MPTQNDLSALYGSDPQLLTTFIIIAVVIALILMSWGACLYAIISSCVARRRYRRNEEEMDRRREQVDAFMLSVIGGRRLDDDTRSIRSQAASSLNSERTLVPTGSAVVDADSEKKETDPVEPASVRRQTEVSDSMV